MNFKEFDHVTKIGPNNVTIPIFIPDYLLENETKVLNKLSENNIPVTIKETNYSFQEYVNVDTLDRFKIIREHKTEHSKLELVTIVETDIDPEARIAGLKYYEPFAGDLFDKRLFEPYTKSVSRTSTQNGIYFSPQDTLTIELSIESSEDRGISVGITDRAVLYWAPRISFGYSEKLDSNDPFEKSLSDYLVQNKENLPERGPSSLKHTSEGVEVINGIIDCYAQALFNTSNI